MEVVEVTIKKQIKIDGKPVSNLFFREPELGDLIDAEENCGGDLAQTSYTLARMCGAEYAEFRKIGGSDIKQIIEKCSDLLGNA